MQSRKLRCLPATLVILGSFGVGATTAAEPLHVSPAQYQTGLPNPVPPVQRAESLVSAILRDQQTLRAELSNVELRARQVRLTSIARGRAFVRMTRAGLLPA